MSGAARKSDNISGITDEHSGHHYDDEDEQSIPSHQQIGISGNINGGSNNVFINGLPAARIGDITNEYDECCGSGHGSVGEGSKNVFINGLPAARIGDKINAHSGTVNITTGSNNVFIGN